MHKSLTIGQVRGRGWEQGLSEKENSGKLAGEKEGMMRAEKMGIRDKKASELRTATQEKQNCFYCSSISGVMKMALLLGGAAEGLGIAFNSLSLAFEGEFGALERISLSLDSIEADCC